MTWQIAAFSLVGIALLGGFAWYERSRPPAKVLALVAALAALAVLGRIAFAPIPNVKPTTDIVLLAGFALGGAPGFAVGAVTALVSNVFFGHGPWTPWQMAAWGGVGVAGAALGRLTRGRELGRLALAAACGLAGLGFGLVLDTYQWTLTAERTVGSFVAVSSTSLPFNVAHAIGNVIFCLIFGPALVRALRRFRERFEVRWQAPDARSAAPPVAALAVALAIGLALLAPGTASAASGSAGAARYLERAQNGDGGFGSAKGDNSFQLYTGWAALGLAAAGENPRDVSRGKRSVIDYIASKAGALDETGDLSRTILVAESAGLSARDFGGRDLVAALERRRGASGAYDGLVNQTAFAILALEASGGGSGAGKSAGWLEDQQNGDGGYGYNTGRSDVDVTGAVLQALAAAGRGRGGAAKDALRYLERAQRGNGGFGQEKGDAPNAQSTAFAVQGIVAAGRNPNGFGRGGALRYLSSLQASDGSIRFSGSSDQDPVWVTAQALLALEKRAFPLAAVARSKGAGGADAGVGDGAGGVSGGGGATGGAGALPGGNGLQGGGGLEGGSGFGGGAGGAGSSGALAPGDAGSSSAKDLLAGAGEEAEEGGSVLGIGRSAVPPATEPAAAQPSAGSGGSVIGGIGAAVASAVLVVGIRRRLRKRLQPAPASEAAAEPQEPPKAVPATPGPAAKPQVATSTE